MWRTTLVGRSIVVSGTWRVVVGIGDVDEGKGVGWVVEMDESVTGVGLLRMA